jgi:hypothetical protein
MKPGIKRLSEEAFEEGDLHDNVIEKAKGIQPGDDPSFDKENPDIRKDTEIRMRLRAHFRKLLYSK